MVQPKKRSKTILKRALLSSYEWWWAPVFSISFILFLFLSIVLSRFVISAVTPYESPIASKNQSQTQLVALNVVLAATAPAVEKPKVPTVKKPLSSLSFTPLEPVIYVPVLSTGNSGGGGGGQSFFGRGSANNKVGMYVQNSGDQISAASGLINSNGGDWGYVLLTMNLNDRGGGTWQNLFDAAANSHVIPVIQLFNAGSCNADDMDFDGLAEMLNGLKWPSAHRYISIFNEVNAGDYWCGNASGESYAKALDKAIRAFKDKSSDFFIMPAAFNSSARTGAVSNEKAAYIGEDLFLSQMNSAVPGIFTKIDGWASHSYPQPNFSGAIYGGRDSIINYNWELGLLRNLGVGTLPVFITETGWLHREGQESCGQYSQGGLLSADAVAARYQDAYTNYWLRDSKVVAVMPFIWASNDACAAGFAWQKPDGSLYPQGEMLKGIPKTAGSPN